MSGALLQLAALGAQDLYLTGNPEITLFKKKYLRYTNFSVETDMVSFDGPAQFGGTTTATLENFGDLISKIVLVVKLQQNESTIKWGYVDRIGHAIIDNIKIRIGQSDIDTIYNDWIDIYQRLNKDKSQEENYNKMIGNIPSLKKIDTVHNAYNLFIPIEVWTGKNTNSTFPICCIKNQSFQISITFRNSEDIVNYYGPDAPSDTDLPIIESSYLLVDYIFLDEYERNLFMTSNHEYLIETVDDMTDTVNTVNTKINLIFTKQTKYLVWYAQLDRYRNRNEYMVWATDNNWEKAKENFAKLVWLITRTGLDASDPTNPVINFNTNYVNIGQVPSMVVGGNTLLENMASKVDAIILFAEYIDNDVVAKATIDNVILTRNEITFEDMSTTNVEFKNDSNTTEQQLNFLNIHTYNIIDIFNYGNFINRSDNPIINSSFQINGVNRFQERDGYFYNYLQPYYYFKNAPPDGINVYTFSLKPDETQPSGCINLGNVDSKDLLLTLGKNNNNSDSYLSFFQSGNIRVFASCYEKISIYQGNASINRY